MKITNSIYCFISPTERLLSTYPPALLKETFNFSSERPLFACTHSIGGVVEDNALIIPISSTEEAIKSTSSKDTDAVLLVSGFQIDEYKLLEHGISSGDLIINKNNAIELKQQKLEIYTKHLDNAKLSKITSKYQKETVHEQLTQRIK